MLDDGLENYAHIWANVEPLTWWVREIAKVRAVLRCAAQVKGGEAPAPADWSALGYHHEKSTIDRTVLMGRVALATILNQHLTAYGIGLSVDGDLRVQTVRGYGILPVIWRQVLAEVTSARLLAFCSECGELYTPKRAPTPGAANYCPACRTTAAKRRHYHKSKLAREDHTERVVK